VVRHGVQQGSQITSALLGQTLRILVVTSSFPRFPGDSSGIFILNLCKELQKLGIGIEVLAPHAYGSRWHETWDGIQLSRFSYFYPLRFQKLCYGAGILKNIKQSPAARLQLPFFILFEMAYALWIARKGKVDLVHAHWSIPQGVTGLLLGKFLGIPCVTSLHGSDVHGLNLPFLRGLNKKVILASEVCTANSRATAQRAQEISGRNDIRVIPMGVDIDFFSASAGRTSGLRHNGKQGRIVLYAGRLIDVKGVEYLIRAFPAVLERQTDAKLLVVGSGPRKEDLISLSESLHLQGKVIFHDAVSQEELVRYYSMAEVFVLPSVTTDERETEGLGVVLLEAMACGVPVIGSAVGGIPDIIRDQETGLLVRPKDPGDLAEKINRVLIEEDLGQRLSEKGRGFVRERFSWSVIARNYLELFRSVLEKKGMGGGDASRS
jgi:glycosyltransferase involved in cell wall biosynthesis